jgi:hypothetical protein
MAESGSEKPQESPDPSERAELTALVRTWDKWWVIKGPCLDGGWFAIPRYDRNGPWVNAPTLAELDRLLRRHESGAS